MLPLGLACRSLPSLEEEVRVAWLTTSHLYLQPACPLGGWRRAQGRAAQATCFANLRDSRVSDLVASAGVPGRPRQYGSSDVRTPEGPSSWAYQRALSSPYARSPDNPTEPPTLPYFGGPKKYLSRGDRAAPRPPDAEPRAPRPRLIDLGTDLVAASGTQHRGRGAALDVAPVAVTAIATGLAW